MSDTDLKSPLFSQDTYDKLKPVAMYYLPALAVFYLTVAPLWGLPKQEEVAATIMALDTFLGVLLGISSNRHQAIEAAVEDDYKGILDITGVDPDTNIADVQLKFTDVPNNFADRDSIRVKINPPDFEVPKFELDTQ